MKTWIAREKVKILSLTFLAIITSLTVLFSIHQHLTYRVPSLQLPHEPVSQVSIPHDPSTVDLKRLLSPEDHRFRGSTTHYYYWNVTSGVRTPDGFSKTVYLINDEFPGPTIEARSGDTLVVEVTNSLPNDEGISIHWHGMSMRESNEMDGAVGFTQCAIPPGSNFTYIFQIDDDQAGTFWYHSHSHEQTGDGLYGGLVVHQPAAAVQQAAEYDYDEEVLLLIGDWGHESVVQRLGEYLDPISDGREPVPDTLLINGLGLFDCSEVAAKYDVPCPELEKKPQPQLLVEKQKSYRIRIVNVGSLAGITVTMPGSEMKVIQVDGGNSIESAASTNSVGILYPGERVDVITTWMDCPDDVDPEMIIALDRENFAASSLFLSSIQHFPVSLLSSTNSQPNNPTPHPTTEAITTFDLSKARGSPVPPETFPEKAQQTIVIYANMMLDALNHEIPAALLNRTTWKMQRNPAAALLALDRDLWDENQFVVRIDPPETETAGGGGGGGTWVDVVLNNQDITGHPFHLHGHTFHILTTCQPPFKLGSYNPWADPSPPCGPYNLLNPVQKDTVYVPARGHVVLRFYADHEGIWMFHCHILWHQAAGMAMAFQVGGGERGVFVDDPLGRRETAGRFCRF